MGIPLNFNQCVQSWKMSNLLHGPISANQILPWEKRVNRNIFGTSNLKNRTGQFFTRIYPSYPWHFATMMSIHQGQLTVPLKISHWQIKYSHQHFPSLVTLVILIVPSPQRGLSLTQAKCILSSLLIAADNQKWCQCKLHLTSWDLHLQKSCPAL